MEGTYLENVRAVHAGPLARGKGKRLQSNNVGGAATWCLRPRGATLHCILCTSSRHVYFKFMLLLSGDTIMSYLGHLMSNSSSCTLTEPPCPLQSFQQTFLAIVCLHTLFNPFLIFSHSNHLLPLLRRCLLPEHVALPSPSLQDTSSMRLVFCCLLSWPFALWSNTSHLPPRLRHGFFKFLLVPRVSIVTSLVHALKYVFLKSAMFSIVSILRFIFSSVPFHCFLKCFLFVTLTPSPKCSALFGQPQTFF